MLKIVIIYFALLSLILAGCGSKSPEPEVVEQTSEVGVKQRVEDKPVVEEKIDLEEKLDLEHVKKIEEQEREQEQKTAEFLAQETAAAEEKKSAIVAEDKKETAAKIEQELPAKVQLEASESDSTLAENAQANASKEVSAEVSQVTSSDSAPKVSEEVSTKDSQKAALETTSETTQEVSQDVSKEAAEDNAQETMKVAAKKSTTDISQKVSKDEITETSVKKPEAAAIIVKPKQEESPPLFMPTSRLALLTALKLVSCKNVPEKMEAIFQRLQKTKDLNIADRRLRDINNDSLMPVVHFDFDQIKIKPDYKKLLRQQSSCVMKALEARGDMIVQIEGHADERGSDEYNLALGHRRANAIANSIMAYLPDSTLARILSYGEEFPLDPDSGKSAWDKNRRVEFTLLLKP